MNEMLPGSQGPPLTLNARMACFGWRWRSRKAAGSFSLSEMYYHSPGFNLGRLDNLTVYLELDLLTFLASSSACLGSGSEVIASSGKFIHPVEMFS